MGTQQISSYFFVPENWGWSDPDPKLIIPDPANNFGSDQIRIHNTAELKKKVCLHIRSSCEWNCTIHDQIRAQKAVGTCKYRYYICSACHRIK